MSRGKFREERSSTANSLKSAPLRVLLDDSIARFLFYRSLSLSLALFHSFARSLVEIFLAVDSAIKRLSEGENEAASKAVLIGRQSQSTAENLQARSVGTPSEAG